MQVVVVTALLSLSSFFVFISYFSQKIYTSVQVSYNLGLLFPYCLFIIIITIIIIIITIICLLDLFLFPPL